MIETFAIPALVTVLAWWISTGLVLMAARRCPVHQGLGQTRGVWLGGLVAAAGFGIAWWSSRSDTAWAALAGFGAAILIWGWIEYAFLTGKVTGTHQKPCPPDARGWNRFFLAAGTVIHHEIILFAAAGALALVSLTGGHATAFWTFAILLVMRLSTKFNLFLGVANFTDGFLPARLGYLKSYFRKRSWNGLMGLSIVGALAISWWWAETALGAPSGTASQFGAALIAVLAFLGLIEHGFLIFPMKESALWRWAMPTQRPISSGVEQVIAEQTANWRAETREDQALRTKMVPSANQND